MNECFYCKQGKTLDDLMLPVCELEYVRVYLMKNQNYPGRCVVVYREHVRELFELAEKERCGFTNELALVSRVLSRLFKADKMNYGIYGDNLPHLHCHVAPKHRDGYTWGAPFSLSGNDSSPPLAELEETAGAIRAGIGAEKENT